MTDPEVVVRLRDVSQRFVIHTDRSIKERVLYARRSKRQRVDFYALRNVTLDFAGGSMVGLIGANGSGKSTLLKTVAGVLQPTSGEVLHRGRIAALLELGAGFHPDLTGKENVYLNASILGLSRKETEAHFDEIVQFSGIGQFIDTQVKYYSSGMYVRLAFSVAVHVDPDVLIIDEVLAVGDEAFQQKCVDRIREFQRAGKTIIFVSHSLGLVAELCDRTIVLDHGTVIFDGEPRRAIELLREGYAEARHEDETASGRAPDIAHIESASLELSGTGDVLGDDRSLGMRVEISTTSRVENLVVAMAIETASGHLAFGTSTEILGMLVPALTGSQLIRFDIERLNLSDGSYNVSARVSTLDDPHSTRVAHVGSFTVRTPTPNDGIIAAIAKVRLEKRP